MQIRLPLHLLPSPRRAAFACCALICAAGFLAASREPALAAQQVQNPDFSATVTSVETSPGANGWRYLTVSVHLRNLTKQPLILALDPGKVSATDDRGNAYAVTQVRGIGEIRGTVVDPKFVLPAEDGADALVEMRWRGDRNAIFGTTFDLTLPARVVVPLEGGQFKLGTERLVRFTGLKSGLTATPKEAGQLPPNTVDAGPFTMQILRLTPTTSGNRRLHTATLSARIQNTSAKPLVLAYEGTSSFGVDDQGNRYGYGTPGTHDTSVSGIGLSTRNTADPQFVLAPGESREVQFRVVRPLGRDTAGTKLTYYVALAELETLPGNQIRQVRQYSLAFPRLPGLN
jgi:hypothetical protein